MVCVGENEGKKKHRYRKGAQIASSFRASADCHQKHKNKSIRALPRISENQFDSSRRSAPCSLPPRPQQIFHRSLAWALFFCGLTCQSTGWMLRKAI